MDKSGTNRLRTVIITIALVAALALLVGLAFLPSVRSGRSVAASARTAGGIDAEAVGVLGSCRAYAAANDYTTDMNGVIKARVYGIPYTQKITGRREVDEDRYFELAESVSMFVKAGIKKECTADKYCVYKGAYGGKKKGFSYGNPTEYDKSGYIAAYGNPFRDIVRYELDDAVIVAEKTGENTYRYVLDCSRATAYSRNEVKTTLGIKKNPRYDSVEFTLETDGTRAIKVTSTEKFFVDKMGGADCTAQYTEVFKYN